MIPTETANVCLALPLPTMTKGALAAFNTEMASVTAAWSAKLTGGGGQQLTSLQQRQFSECLTPELWQCCYAIKTFNKSFKNDNKPDFAPVHFSIDHVPGNVNINSPWTAIYARADSL